MPTTSMSLDMERENQCDGTVVRGAKASSKSEHVLGALASDFEQLYALVHRYLSHRFFDPELAEELTAQTFHNAAVSISRFRGDVSQIRFWLLRVATNLANTHHRRNRLRHLLRGDVARATAMTRAADSSSDSADEPRVARVRSVLLSMRPKYQTVVVLRYYTQMSFAEIAAVTGLRQEAVRARLSRAIKEMRQRLGLGEAGDVASDH